LLSIQPSPKSRAATKYPESERRAAAAKARGRGRRRRGRRRAEQRCSLQVPFQGGGGALPAGPAKGGGGGAPGAVQRPQGQGLQPSLLRRAPPPPRPAPHRGPQVAAASLAAAGPRDLPQRLRGGHRRRGGRHRAGHLGPDPSPGPTHRHRADVPRRWGEVARRHPRGGAGDVFPWHQGAAFLSFCAFIFILSNNLRAWVLVAALS